MPNNQVLSKLRELASVPEITSQFSSQQECIAWANKIVALLSFDKEIQNSFIQQLANINNPSLSGSLQRTSFNNMLSILHVAISDLENNQQESEIPTTNILALECPQKVTLKWLWEHVPHSFWALLGGILLGAFGFGVKFAETNLYKSLTNPTSANTNNAVQKIMSSATKK